MKTKLLLAFSALLALLTTSCNVTENITFNEDGSGIMTIEMDGSQLMAMAGDELGKQGRIDSTFSFKEMFKERADSIAKLPKEDQERFKVLEKLEGHMLVDPETGEFKIDFNNRFKSANELVNLMNGFSALSKMKEGAAQAPSPLDNANPDVNYFYDGKKFKKTVKEKPKAEEEGMDEAMEQLNAMFEQSSYTVNYKFPKKVKSVSNKNAKISDDKKTVTVVYSFLDYMETPKSMDIEVVFE